MSYEEREYRRREPGLRRLKALGIGALVIGFFAPTTLVAFAALVIGFNAYAYASGTRRHLRTNMEHPVPEDQRRRIASMVKQLWAEAGRTAPRIDIVRSNAINAASMRLTRKRSGTLLVTRGLLKCDDAEIRAILLHELSHDTHADSGKMMVMGIPRLGAYLGAEYILFDAFVSAFKGVALVSLPALAQSLSAAVFGPAFLAFLGTSTILKGVQNILSRHLEYRSDQLDIPGRTPSSAEQLELAKDLAAVDARSFLESFVATASQEKAARSVLRTHTIRVLPHSSDLGALRRRLQTDDRSRIEKLAAFFTEGHPTTENRIRRLVPGVRRAPSTSSITHTVETGPSGPTDVFRYRLEVDNVPVRRSLLRRTATPKGSLPRDIPALRVSATAEVRENGVATGTATVEARGQSGYVMSVG